MATGNFLNVNASKIFECDKLSNFEEESIVNKLEEMGLDSYKKDETDCNRNYPGVYFGVIYKSWKFYEADIGLQIKLVRRNGYYESGNLDYEFVFDLADSADYDTISEVEDDLFKWARDYAGKAEPLFKHKLPKFIEKMEKEIEEATDAIEKLYSEYSTELYVDAIASNGETSYCGC